MKYFATIAVIVALGILVGASLKDRVDRENLEPTTSPEISVTEGPDEQKGAPMGEPKKRMQKDGMTIEIIKEGSGREAEAGSVAVVHYTGKLSDGSVFDSSLTRGKPFEFNVGAGNVIKGWDLGVIGMKVGEKRLLTIPPALGYGANGYPPVIPANATLTFEVELIGVK